MNDDLLPVLKQLKLSGILQSIDVLRTQATEQSLSLTEFLYFVLHDEVERRSAKRLQHRTDRANFEEIRTLEDFDFTFNPAIPRATLLELGTCAWVDRRENVILVGIAGVGKSHLAQVLGLRACHAGHTVHLTSANDMLVALRAARADDTVERRMLKYTTPQVLIIDDLGIQPLRGDEPLDLFEVIRRRYERSSTVITSNRATDEWSPLFGDALLGSAACDRLLHHAHVIEIEGESFRARRASKPKTV